MLRKIITIDEEKCNGCGVCVPECHEGALQIIDGKARLISDLFCDGLGACIGFCPEDALKIEEREAEPYDERKVMEYIVKGGRNVIKAHLEHLRDHKEFQFLAEAIDYLQDKGMEVPLEKVESEEHANAPNCGCSGSAPKTFNNNFDETFEEGTRQSHLTHWPIQLHLVNPNAGYFQNSDLLLAADCCGFSIPDFHKEFLKGKTLSIACPKLDSNKQAYLDKLVIMINESNIKSLTVLIMQVPCCSGLFQLAQTALEMSQREIPLNVKVIGIDGTVLKDVQVS
jgi:NAD-dependent dihydropyrimidine dehydrogenase PreA subunit